MFRNAGHTVSAYLTFLEKKPECRMIEKGRDGGLVGRLKLLLARDVYALGQVAHRLRDRGSRHHDEGR